MSELLVLYLASLTFRSLWLMAFAGLITIWLRSVAVRHAVWTVTLGSILLLPLADAVAPAAPAPASIRQISVQPSFMAKSEGSKSIVRLRGKTAADQLPSGPAHYNWWQLALMVYAAVAAFLLLRTGVAHGRILSLKRTGRQAEAAAFNELVDSLQFRWRSPKLVESSQVRVPVTVGFVRPVVLLPEAWRSWSVWNLRAVLAHELTHVRRADWPITVLAGLNRCLFWFNPFSWWLERKLCSLAEQASDEASVLLVGDAPRYAEVLLAFAAEVKDGHRLAGGTAMAKLNIRARIDRILTLERPQSGVLKRAGWVAIMVVMMPVLYVVASGQGKPSKPAATAPEARRIETQATPQQSPMPELQTKSGSQTPTPAADPEKLKPLDSIDDAFNPLLQDRLRQSYQGTLDLYQNNLLSDEIQKAFSEPEAQRALQNGTLNRWLNGPGWLPFPPNEDYKLPSNITLPPNSYAFLVTGTQGGSVSFRRAEGTVWKAVSYGCQNCTFFVNESGVGPENLGGPGILFKAEEKTPDHTGNLTLTCRARECWAVPVSTWSVDPAAARFKFDTAKFDMEKASNFSQVLIIISR